MTAGAYIQSSVPQPTVSLHKLLQHALPVGSYLVSGSPDVQISWARMLKSQAVTTAGPQPGELALVPTSTIQRLREPGRELARMIGALAQVKAQAVGIQGSVDVKTLEAAAENNIAVISLPVEVEATQVERDIVRLIMDFQAQLEQRANELQEELMRHAMSNRGLPSLVKILAKKVDKTVIVHDRTGLTLARGIAPNGNANWERQMALLDNQELMQQFETTFSRPGNHGVWQHDDMLIAPLTVERQIVGYISFLLNNGIDEFDAIALQRGAVVCSMELAKQRAVEIAMERVRGDWIQLWLSNSPLEDHTLVLRAERGGFNPEGLYAVVVFRWAAPEGLRRNEARFSPDRMTDIIRQELNFRRIEGMVGQYVDRTILLLPIDDAQHTLRMKQTTDVLRSRLQQIAGKGVVSCGVGRARIGLKELRESFKEAEKALALSDQLWAEPRVTFFGDLSLYELLLSVNSDGLRAFCNNWLADIIDYDDQHKSELLVTLDAYFGSNGNMRLTAKELNIHRNTLVYRLNRISEITQLDMDDANVHLNLHLALKAYHLLKTFNL